MNKETGGSLWPLQLLFLAAFACGLLALLAPTFLTGQPTLDWGLAGVLFGIASLAAILLYWPRFWIAMNAKHFPDTAADIDAMKNDILGTGASKPFADLVKNVADIRAALGTTGDVG